MLSRADLFARLAEGHAARVTVVTPNKRLSQELQREFDAFQIGKGLSVWEAPDILPFSAFVGRLYEDALYSDIRAELPMLLAPAQEEEIWRQVLSGGSLLAVAETAAKCRDAWSLANLWRIRPGAGNEDTGAFSAWLKKYLDKTAGNVDAARLPDVLSDLLQKENLPKPKTVVAYAFDILPPQTKEFLDALGSEVVFSSPAPRSASVVRASFDSSKHQI